MTGMSMRQSISNGVITLFRYSVIILLLTSCEKPILTEGYDESGNVTLTFSPSTGDMRSTVAIGDYFQKLNIMLFDEDGNRVFEKVRTQLREDDDFGRLNLSLSPGTYSVVAVGHSSAKSATIKSTEMVQFTASDGEKLTDTFCHYSVIEVTDDPEQHDLLLRRVGAMIQFSLTDEQVPESFARLKIEYTGGSANFNPQTFEGTTKSSQSEMRQAHAGGVYQVFTFPYQSETCSLRMTLTALDADGNTIRSRVFDAVPVTRNRATVYTGHFFEPGDGQFTQTAFGFTINGEWEGTDEYEF